MLNALILLFLIACGFLVVFSLYSFHISIRPNRIYSNINPEKFHISYERLNFSSADGVGLTGWFIPKKGSPTDKVVILMHGYPADKGDIFPSMIYLQEYYNLFFFDFRYFGESQGSFTAIGGKEVNDLLGAIETMKQRGMKKIGFFGFSMGGAVGLMSLQDTQEIAALVTDSAYSRLDLLAEDFYKPFGFLAKPLIFLTNLWSRFFLGVDLTKVSPADKVKGMQVPILLMHSKNDEMIPFAHALMLQESLKNNPNAEFIFREGSFHGMLDPNYQKEVLTFFQKYL